jgi:hypothetical protein
MRLARYDPENSARGVRARQLEVRPAGVTPLATHMARSEGNNPVSWPVPRRWPLCDGSSFALREPCNELENSAQHIRLVRNDDVVTCTVQLDCSRNGNLAFVH